MAQNDAMANRRTVLKKGAVATGAVTGGLATLAGSAAAAVTCDMVIDGQGEFTLHYIAGGLDWTTVPTDITINSYDSASGQLVTMDGTVSSESDGPGNDYFSGTVIDWDENGYKNALWDDGVTVTICGQERDDSDW